jgi:putative transposase
MGIRYQSEAIQHYRRGKRKPEVLVRVSRHDIGSISVWFGKGWVTVPAVYEEFKGMSLYAWSVACNALRAENREKARMSRLTIRKTREHLKKNAQVARLEAGLGTGCINDADIAKWEGGVKFEVGATTGEAIPEDFAKDLVVDPQFYLDMGITVSAEVADYVVDPRDAPEASEPAPEKPKGQARGTQASKKFTK